MNLTITQLRQWLERPLKTSAQLRVGLSSSLDACEVVICGIQEHLSRLKCNDGSGSIGLGARFKYILDENTLKGLSSSSKINRRLSLPASYTDVSSFALV